MVQGKGNLPVADSRSSEERDQENQDVMPTASRVRVHTAPQALGKNHRPPPASWPESHLSKTMAHSFCYSLFSPT